MEQGVGMGFGSECGIGKIFVGICDVQCVQVWVIKGCVGGLISWYGQYMMYCVIGVVVDYMIVVLLCVLEVVCGVYVGVVWFVGVFVDGGEYMW